MPSDGKTAKVLKKYQLTPAHLAYYYGVGSYYGPQPFTAGPMYLGAISIFLFLLGLFCLKGGDRWWILAASLLAVLLALGSHFIVFTKLAMNVLPLYNKFRTVSMSLIILQVCVPLLGFLALDRIVRGEVDAAAFKRGSLWALGIAGGFCLLMTLFPGLSGSFLSDAEASGLPKDIAAAVSADRIAMLRSDALVSLLLIVASWGLLVWGCRGEGTVRRVISGVTIGALVLVNMFVVGRRYLKADDFVTPRSFEGQFAQRPADKAILADTDPSFRVLDLTVNVFNDSHPSYWHKSVGGYSPAKLQLYQEFIEKRLSGEISTLKDALKGAQGSVAGGGQAGANGQAGGLEAAVPMLPGLSALNCLYFIVDGGTSPVRNPYAMGPAWFEEGDGSEVSGGPDAQRIELLSYTPNELRYRYSSPVAAKAVFSEVFYPEGWTLKVADTEEVLPISLSHEVLRSAVLPAGEHELVMRFAPDSYLRGRMLSLICSILTLLLAIGAVLFSVIGGKKTEEA